jgi:hemerythrin-like domain-containing protein
VCEYCGCRQIEPLAELMDEHLALLDLAGDVRRHLAHARVEEGLALLRRTGDLLDRHARREEDGVFAALRETGEFVEEVDELTGEHSDFHARIVALEASDPRLGTTVDVLLGELTTHIDREDLGIFPVSVVTLGATGWDTVSRVHGEQPSFLASPPPRGAAHGVNECDRSAAPAMPQGER